MSRCAKADDVRRTLAGLPGVYRVEFLRVERCPDRGCRISAFLRLFPEGTDSRTVLRDAARTLFERHGVSEVSLGAEPYRGGGAAAM